MGGSMKKKLFKYLMIVVGTSLICFIGIMFWYRLRFGVWDPFDLPDRINCYGRRYYMSKLEPTDVVKNQDQLEPINWPNNSTFRKLYVDPNSIMVKTPLILYIKTSDGKYQCYSLSGSG